MNQELSEKIAKILLIILFGVYPFFVNPLSSPVFTHPKVTLLWIIGFALLLLVYWRYSQDSSKNANTNGADLQLPGKLGLLALPICVYIFSLIISTLNSRDYIVSFFGQYSRWDGFLSLFSEIAIFCAIVLLINKSKIKPLINALMFSTTAVSLLAIYERFAKNPLFILTKTYDPAGYGSPNTYDMSRSMATFGNPLYLAAFLVTVLPVLITIAMNENDKKSRMLAIITTVLGSVALVLTYGRGAWLGFVVAISFLLIHKAIKARQFIAILVTILTIGLAVQFTALKGSSVNFTDRVASIFKMEAGARPEMWKASLSMIKSEPLFGYGIETFKSAFQKFKPTGWMVLYKQPLLDKAHNEILQTTASSGLLGLTIIVWLLVSIYLYVLKKIKSKPGKQYISIGFIAGGLAYIVQSFFDFFTVSAAPIFWGVLALAVSSLNDGDSLKLYSKSLSSKYKIIKKIPLVFLGMAFVVVSSLGILSWTADYSFQKYLDLKFNNKSGDAVKRIDTAAKLFPWEDRYLISLGKANAQMAREYGDFSKIYLKRSQEAFDLAKEINPQDEEAYFAQALIFLEFAQKDPMYLKASIDDFNKGLFINPTNLDALASLGLAYAYDNQLKKAISSWEKAVKGNPDQPNVLFNMGLVYERLSLQKRAVKAYQAALSLDKNMASAKERLKSLNRIDN